MGKKYFLEKTKLDAPFCGTYTKQYFKTFTYTNSYMSKTKKGSSVKKSASKRESSIGITPLSDRVVIKPLSIDEMGSTTASGIIIPDSAKEKPEQGTVVAVGAGKWDEDGERRIPMSVSIGDTVMFSKYGFDTIKVSGVEYYVVSESNVLAILN